MALQESAPRAQFRRTVEFQPSAWGDYFVHKVLNDELLVVSWKKEAEVLKEEVRKLFTSTATGKPSQQLNLVDVVLRLGIGYHFGKEINEALSTQACHDYSLEEGLFTVALRFRLLRQHGYNISCDVFNKYKDGEGKFKEHLMDDAKGLLSLYEASFLSVPGEKTLDEALSFCKTHLESIVGQLVSPFADQVRHALKRPLHRGVPKHEQWYYIATYQQEDGRVKPLLKLAKLEFNILQTLYQDELKIISKWWIDLDFATKLPFARDRLIECYFWALGIFCEPQFVLSRRLVTKFSILGTMFDDIYDVHGTMEELELFTKMIESWDTSLKDLPDYMKLSFMAVIGVLDEIEEETIKEERPYCKHYSKESVKSLVKAYLTEAQWFNEDHVPTLEEYRRIGIITTNYMSITIACLCGMGKIASEEVFQWLLKEPKLLIASADHCRLMDDIVTHEFEQERGHVASSVECYMKQYGVSMEEAHDRLYKIVESDWKDINEELLKPSAIPKQILTIYLNMARIMDVLYKDFDSYTKATARTKDMLASLLVNPLPI